MKRTMARLLAICLSFVAFDASAVLVTMEPDAFESGTDVSNAWESYGISMERVLLDRRFDPLRSEAVHTRSFANAFTGSQVFSSTAFLDQAVYCEAHPLGPTCTTEYGFSVLRVDFARPVDRFEVFGSYGSDPLSAAAYDASGNLLEHCRGQYSGAPCFSFLFETTDRFASVQFERETRDISYVLVGGHGGVAWVDMMRVNVPEPATLGLMSIGLLGALVRRRRLQPT